MPAGGNPGAGVWLGFVDENTTLAGSDMRLGAAGVGSRVVARAEEEWRLKNIQAMPESRIAMSATRIQLLRRDVGVSDRWATLCLVCFLSATDVPLFSQLFSGFNC